MGRTSIDLAHASALNICYLDNAQFLPAENDFKAGA